MPDKKNVRDEIAKWKNIDQYTDQMRRQQAASKPVDSSDLFGATTYGTKVYSESQMKEMANKNVDVWKAHQPGYDHQAEMLSRQTTWDAVSRAVGGGLYKGGLSILENVGYMTDFADMLGITNDFDKGYSNWLSEWASGEKKEYDEENPIYSGGTWDMGWWMQGGQSLIDSALGFAVPGGLAGKVIGRAAKVTNQILKGKKALELGATTLTTAVLTNYAESQMMAHELYNNVYNNAIANGSTEADAQRIASEEGKDFMFQNKVNIITDMIALKGLANGKGVIKGLAQKSKKQLVGSVAKQAISEGVEEGTGGFLQKENERDAAIRLNIQKKDDSTILSRMSDYVKSDDGFTEMFFGMLGGPFQSAGAKAVKNVGSKSEVAKRVNERMGWTKKEGPGEFKETVPVEPTNSRPVNEARDPGTLEDYVIQLHPDAQDNKAKREVLMKNSKTKKDYDELVKDYEKKESDFQNANKEWAKYDSELNTYEQNKEAHEQRVIEFEKQKEQDEELDNIGRTKQTVKDLKKFIAEEEALTVAYKEAVLKNDTVEMSDIENRKFENLVSRYAKRGAISGTEGALDQQLEAIVKDPNSTEEERQIAKKYLEKLPSIEATYWKIMNKHDSSGNTDLVFKIAMRMENSNDLLGEVNTEIDNAKRNLAREVEKAENKDVSAIELETLTLRKEQLALKNIEKKLGSQFNPKLKKEFDDKIKDYETRIDELTKEYKESESDTVKKTVIESHNDMSEVNKLAEQRAQVWTAYKSYQQLYDYLDSGNYQKKINDEYVQYAEDKISTLDSSEDVNVLTHQVESFNLKAKQREDLLSKIAEREYEINQRESKEAEEFANLGKRFNDLNNLNERLKLDVRKSIGRIGGLTTKLNKFKNLDVSEELAKEKVKSVLNTNRDIANERDVLSRNKLYQSNIQEKVDDTRLELDRYKSIPGASSFDVNLENYFDKINEDENTTPEEKMTVAQDLQEEDVELSNDLKASAVQQSGISPVEKPVVSSDIESNDNTPPISNEVNDAEEILNNKAQNLAYVSQSDERGEHDLALTDWLEIEMAQDKIGTQFEIAIDNSDIKEFHEGVKKEDLSSDVLPIRLYALNNEGKRIVYDNKEVYGWLKAVSPLRTDAENEYLKRTRNYIKRALDKGVTLKPKITKIGGGILKSDLGAKNDIREGLNLTGKDIELMISDGSDLLSDDKRIVSKEEVSFNGGTKGFVYAKVQRPDGTYFPLKMNSKKLSNVEVETVYDIITSLAKGFKPSAIMQSPHVQGISLKEALDLLVYEGEHSLSLGYPFYMNFKSKSLVIGDDISTPIPFSQLAKNEDRIKDFLETMWRTTRLDMINKPMSSKFSNNFKWFGQDVKIDLQGGTMYNDLIMNDGALTTNASFPSNRAFINPYVEISNIETWGIEQLTEETKTLDTPKNEYVGKDEYDNPEAVVFDGLEDLLNVEKIEPTEETTPEEDTLNKETNDTKGISPNDINKDTIHKKKDVKKPNTDSFGFGNDILFSKYEGRTELSDLNKELAELKRILPNVPYTVINSLLRAPGGLADGQFYNGVITISNFANKGVVYHEAFHAVSQLYLSDKDRKALYDEVRKKNPGTDLEVEEYLADKFKEYMISKGTKKTPSLMKRLFDKLLDLVNFFKSKKSKLFSDIRNGRFTYSPPTSQSKQLFERLPFPGDFVNDVVKGMTYFAFNYSGARSLNRNVEKSPIDKTTYDQIWNRFIETKNKAEENGLTNIANQYQYVLNSWDKFVQLTKNEIMSYGFTEQINEDQVDEVDAKEGLNITSSLLISPKTNATGNVKLMVSMLTTPDYSSAYFGRSMPKLADFSESWRRLVSILSGVIDMPSVSLQDRMLSLIKEESENYPPFKELVAQLESDNVPLYKKNQFYNTFYKQNTIYSMSLGVKQDSGIEWHIGNADQQNQANTVRSTWSEEMKLKDLDIKQLQNQRNKFNTLLGFVGQLDTKASIDKGAYDNLSNILSNVGISMTADDVTSFVAQTISPKGESPTDRNKLFRALKSLEYVFNKSPKVKEHKSVETTILENKWDDDNFITNNSIILKLAKVKALSSKIAGDTMVLGTDGKSYQTVSMNNFISKTISQWKNDTTYLDKLLSSTYSAHSLWAGELKSMIERGDGDLVNMEVFLFNKFEDGSDKDHTFTELKKPDEVIDRMNRTLYGATSKNGIGSYFSPLTMADKSVGYQFTGPKFKRLNSGDSISDLTLSIFYNYALAEVKRISDVRRSDTKIDFYDEGGLKSFWVPELSFNSAFANSINLYNEDGTLNLLQNEDNIKDLIRDALSNRITEQRQSLIDLGLFDGVTLHGVSNSIIKAYDTYDNLIADYTLNSMISNIEFTMLFSGDPAFYKDLAKRTPETIATGTDLVPVKGVSPTFNVSVIHDFKIDSTLYDDYHKELVSLLVEQKNITKAQAMTEATQTLKPYKGLNKADAQAYITPNRFRNLMRMLGKWNEELHTPIFEKLTSSSATAKDLLKLQAQIKQTDFPSSQPLKGMHYERRQSNDLMIPTFLKYSQAVLWPSIIAGTKLEKIAEAMKDSKTDELIFKSGVKVGAENITDGESFLTGKTNEIKFTPFPLQNFFWKLQQDLPSKYNSKQYALLGSQPKKNILANLEGRTFTYKGEKISGMDLASLANKVEEDLSNIGIEELKSELAIDSDGNIKNTDNIYETLRRKYIKDKVSNNIIESIEQRAPLDAIFQFVEKNESELYSKFTAKGVKLKAPGGAFIQLSNNAFESNSILNKEEIKNLNGLIHLKNIDELRGARFENGEFKPGEVYLPYKILEQIPDLDKRLQSSLTGEKLLKLIDPKVLDVIGYRIPNQGLSSIDSLTIAGILPASYGDTIVTYSEITAKTGSDFDIDKMYIMMPNTRWNKETNKVERVLSDNTKKGLENKRLEIWESILQAEDTFGDLITPLDSEWLQDDAYYLSFLDEILKSTNKTELLKQVESSSIEDFLSKPNKIELVNKYLKSKQLNAFEFATPEHQIELKSKNAAGKAGIGQTANHLSNHPYGQIADIGLNVNLNIGLTKDGLTTFNNVLNEDNSSITQVISAFLNAFVDNAKDPYISLINNNTKTSNTVFMLLRAGVSPKVVNRFMSQPIIKDFVENEFNSESKIIPKVFNAYETIMVNKSGELALVTKSVAPLDAFRKTSFEWGHSDLSVDIGEVDMTIEGMEKEMLQPKNQLNYLKKFMVFRHYANKLNDAVIASKIDTEGSGGTAAENLKMKELVRKVKSENVVSNFDNLLNDTPLQTYMDNTVNLSGEALGKITLSKSLVVEKAIKTVNYQIGEEYATNTKRSQSIMAAYRTYVYGQNELFLNDIKPLFYGENSMANRLKKLKTILPSNILINSLGVKVVDKGPRFVTMASSKKRDQNEHDILWMEWEKMLDEGSLGDTVIEKGYSVRDFAKDLIKYSYHASGFQKNINSFHDLIPNTFMRGQFNGVDFNDFITLKLKEAQLDSSPTNFIDQYFRHNADDNSLVPSLPLKTKHLKPIINKILNGFSVSVDFVPNKIVNSLSNNVEEISPKPYVKLVSKESINLYKYVGYKDGELYYEAVDVLGLNKKGNVIVEYSSDQNVSSSVNINKKGLPLDVIFSLDYMVNDGNQRDAELIYAPYGEVKRNGNKFTFENLDGEYEIKTLMRGTESYYGLVVNHNNKTRYIGDLGASFEDAFEFGLEKLRAMGRKRIERSLKVEC